jgi:peptidoglycan hydrolase-like protein with peptidoglycan-binding domain
MRTSIVGLITSASVAAFAADASAAGFSDLSVEAVNAAQFEEGLPSAEGPSALVLKAQILLDRNGASPGVIDGVYGDNVAKAITEFRERPWIERRRQARQGGLVGADEGRRRRRPHRIRDHRGGPRL